LRIKPFRLQFTAQAISIAGSMLSPVALALGVLKLTGSASNLSLVLAASAVPMVIFLMVGGVWADRLPRNFVMVACEAVAAAAQFSLGYMLVSGHFSLWIALMVQFIGGTAFAFYFPATTGLTAVTVPSDLLQKANALLSLTRSIAGAAGPLVASALAISVGAGWALIINGGTFVLSAVLLAQIKVILPALPKAPRNFFTELAQGFREVTSRAWVWSSIGAFMFSHLAMAIFTVLGPLVLLSRENGELSWGLVIAAIACGQFAGDLLAMRLVPVRPIVASRLLELLGVPMLVALALDAPLPVLIVTALLAGIAITFPDTLWYTALQQHLPTEKLSRVSSYDWMGSLALRPIGYVSAAAIAAALGVPATLAAAAILMLLTRILGLAPVDVRRLTVQSGAS
jgi:MFS family permease